MTEFVYLTKYATTTGKIRRVEVARVLESGLVFLNGLGGCYKIGSDCFSNSADAIQACEEARIRKLKSLDKQIKKLSAVVYEVQDEYGPNNRNPDVQPDPGAAGR